MNSHKLILGSKSPRRKELLAGLGFEFEIRTKETDESYPESLAPRDVPSYIAEQKAFALIDELQENEVLICSDTVVVVENEILGKPENELEAKKMLQKLSNKTHQVITGVVLQSKKKKVAFSVITDVTFKQLSDNEIKYYVSNYKPLDKAGAYGIQEWIGYIGVISLKGSYFNVVGLPTHEVYEAIKNF